MKEKRGFAWWVIPFFSLLGLVGGIIIGMAINCNHRALSYSTYERECRNDSTVQHMAEVRSVVVGESVRFYPYSPSSNRGEWKVTGTYTYHEERNKSLSDVTPTDSIISIYHSYTHRPPTMEGYGAWVKERTK